MKKTILALFIAFAGYLGLSAAGASSTSGAVEAAKSASNQVMAVIRTGPAGIYQTLRAAMERLGTDVKDKTGV